MQNTNFDRTEITLLGTGSSSHQMVSYLLKKYLEKAEIPFDFKEETDVSSFLERGLVSVPCISIDDEYLPVESNGNFNSSLRLAIKHILKKQNFGNMEKIIIPVDFSDVSTNAFVFGHRMATDLGAVVKAVHVYLPTSKELQESTMVDVDFIELRKGKLNNFVSEFDKDWTSDIMTASLVDGEFRTGFPGDEILDSIEDNGAKMVVMGTTGDSGALKKWFGSVSTRVMNEAPCPVLLVPENAGYHGINNILYAYDDIELDRYIIEQLVDFCEHFDATLHLTHVDSAESSDPGFYLKELVEEKYPKRKIKVSSQYDLDVVSAIDEYANTNGIDVIAMGTRNRSFFDRIFHTSMTQKMAIQSKVPLLILKQNEEWE